MALHRAAKHFGRERPAGRAALTQSLLVERNDRDPGRGERTLDMRRDVTNDAFVELQLTVGGKLEDNAAQHGIIRCPEHNDRQRAQPRYGVRQRHRPERRRAACREQQKRAVLAGQIDQMEYRPFVRDGGRILDDQSAGRERGGNVDFAKRATGNDARSRHPRPDGRQMRLARSLRSDQRDGARRPIRPSIDQRQRALVGSPRQEILARKAFGMIERERKLPRGEGRSAYDGRLPV